MKEKILTIKHEENWVRVTGSLEGINRLIKWSKETKHGKFTSHSIVCDSPKDFIGCKQKAKFLKLSILSPKEQQPTDAVAPNSI